MVSALADDGNGTEVRMETVKPADANARKDFLVMSLATELRARGHAVSGVEE